MKAKSGLWWWWEINVRGPLRNAWWRLRTKFQRCRPCALSGDDIPRGCAKCEVCDL